jgi:hypothetical protein
VKKLLASVGLLCMVALAWPGVVVAWGDTTSELDVTTADAPAPETPAEAGPNGTAPTDTAPPDTTTDDITPADTTPPAPAPEALAPGEPATTTTVAEPAETGGPADETAQNAAPSSATVAGAPTPDGGARVRAQQCEPSYPDICLPPGPDLDCTEIDDRNFSVPGDDPFGFDRDGNGIGCEDDSAPATTTPPTTAPPTTPAPTTSPQTPTTAAPIVAGTTQDRPSGALPVTGSRATLLAVLGLVVLALGVAFVATGGLARRHAPAPTRGGFTLTLSNPQGERLVHRVTSRR